jgi:hypothetical protein
MGVSWGFKLLGELAILPRKGEVAPKVTEGEDTEQRLSCPPLRLASASHLPLAGEDFRRSSICTACPAPAEPGVQLGGRC